MSPLPYQVTRNLEKSVVKSYISVLKWHGCFTSTETRYVKKNLTIKFPIFSINPFWWQLHEISRLCLTHGYCNASGIFVVLPAELEILEKLRELTKETLSVVYELRTPNLPLSTLSVEQQGKQHWPLPFLKVASFYRRSEYPKPARSEPVRAGKD